MYKLHSYSVYIMASERRTLYIGVTNDLIRRVEEHKNKSVRGFTKQYNVTRLVYFENFESITEAIDREKQLKKWNREWKINLIQSENPEWKDLYSDLRESY